MTRDVHDVLLERAKSYQATGHTFSHAFKLASFDMRVDHWPSAWGDSLEALIFGDFDPPGSVLDFESLGISIQPERVEGTVVKAALTVLKARVAVRERTTTAVKDAAARLNLLVGVLSLTNQAAAIRWWSFLTHPSGSAIGYTLGDNGPEGALALVQILRPDVRRLVTASLYWMREPRGMLMEHHRSDRLAVYAGYWNAFECLVDAVDILQPRARSTPTEKRAAITERLKQQGGSLDPGDIASLYKEVVDPGLRTKAEHAIAVCTAGLAGHFSAHCFRFTPPDQGLYNLRNAINHGTIDVDDPETFLIIETRISTLFDLVFTMLREVLFLNLRLVSSAA